MGRDAIALMTVFSTLALSGALTALLFWAGRRFSTTDCPNCGRRIPKTAITDSAIHCPYCPEQPTIQEPLVATEASCRHCGAALQGRQSVKLWDGHDYCEACVAAADSELAEYRLEHDRLEETMPHSAWWPARRMFFIFEASATAVFGSIFFFGGIAQGGILVGIQGLLVSQVLFLPAVLLFTAAHGFGFAARRTTIYVRDGMLNVRYGTSGFAQHDLRKCEWFVGSLGYVNPFLVGQAVLIALPNPKNRQSAFVAVGFTDETRRIWEAFLTLAGGVRRTAWEKKVGRFRKALNIAVGVLSVPFAVGLGVLGARVARDVVFLLTADQALTELVEVMVFMVGTVFSFLYLILFWPWNPPGRAPSKRTRAEQMKIRLIVTLGTVSVILLNLVWPIFQMKKLGLQTQMTTSLIVTALALLIGMDLGKRLATFELASTDPSSPSPGNAPEQPANS